MCLFKTNFKIEDHNLKIMFVFMGIFIPVAVILYDI